MRTLKLAPAALIAVLLAGCTSREPDDICDVGTNTLEAEPGWEPRVKGKKWTHIIIHHGGRHNGSAAIYHRYHRDVKHWRGLGYHFVIGNGTASKDGLVELGFRWPGQERGAHVGGAKNIGKIGICLVGDFDFGKPSAAQMRSLHKLLKFLQIRFQIPASRVKGHHEVARPGYTHCPGKNFSMTKLRARLPVTPPRYDPATVVIRK